MEPSYTSNVNSTQSLLNKHTTFHGIFSVPGKLTDKITNLIIKIFTLIGITKKLRETAKARLETRVLLQLVPHKTSLENLNTAINEMQANIQVIIHRKKNILKINGKPQNSDAAVASSIKMPSFNVENKDATQAALEMKKNNERVALIDLASAFHPCGSFNVPFLGTQEEAIAEKTALLSALDRETNKTLKEVRQGKKTHIPKHGCVFVPSVPVIRDLSSRKILDIENLDSFQKIDIIAVAALDLRSSCEKSRYTGKNGDFNQKGIDVTKDKMRSALYSAKINNVRYLVLGALGCGAFKNKPETIAGLWKEVIQEPEFSNAFDEITFAVYVSPRSQDKTNFEIFQKTFG